MRPFCIGTAQAGLSGSLDRLLSFNLTQRGNFRSWRLVALVLGLNPCQFSPELGEGYFIAAVTFTPNSTTVCDATCSIRSFDTLASIPQVKYS
jgi:hypothetical protein